MLTFYGEGLSEPKPTLSYRNNNDDNDNDDHDDYDDDDNENPVVVIMTAHISIILS
jgi:hypothetical protein